MLQSSQGYVLLFDVRILVALHLFVAIEKVCITRPTSVSQLVDVIAERVEVPMTLVAFEHAITVVVRVQLHNIKILLFALEINARRVAEVELAKLERMRTVDLLVQRFHAITVALIFGINFLLIHQAALLSSNIQAYLFVLADVAIHASFNAAGRHVGEELDSEHVAHVLHSEVDCRR